ncbi:glyoxylate reductase KNAG_0F00440 [Huiozyma naganishii CBS 8797]|uniref:D-isomer specific 2-hydroxyacid dehydrogenase NAD-binding domain-containing protein n=1 Tax=Huiozyma naganishii (strain ATCC MYA-139 / BCRC 22969 / CBS 8797 / KCTC 17520 / NBRC 10181 / NCYC 3082 / Yp74L-3) TaxID=1071383 RepID=J7RME0_HUIN7|nr:hypothetical protein KNAG_0F00440 [Kazachstania naganishii CBS 8797]CCK70713.1 hypothetical protein KNAG_0F00440 [Kazachstania naganishii CBS 8797]
MSKPIVLRLGDVLFAQKVWDQFEEVAEVVTIDETVSREEFFKLLKDPKCKASQAKVITHTVQSLPNVGKWDKEVADHLPDSVIAVCHNGAGYDQIEVEHFNKRHIQVSNTPKLVNHATADTHTFLVLGALRNYSYGYRNFMAGKWPELGEDAGGPFGHDPEGKVVGILGFGNIGHSIAKRLRPHLFSKIIYYNRKRLPAEEEDGCEWVPLDELLATADVISVSLPLNPATRHFVNAETFKKMKDGVVIVNTARGAVIDERALVDALKSGKVRSAGLDVFEYEPQVTKELMEMPQVLGLPHMGTHTIESRQNMEEFVIANARSAAEKGKVLSIVPELKDEDWVKKL